MDFKILLLVLCITFVSVQGAIPRCCVKTSPVAKGLLKTVKKFDVQDRNGACDIDALVLHTGRKIWCVPVWQKKYLIWKK